MKYNLSKAIVLYSVLAPNAWALQVGMNWDNEQLSAHPDNPRLQHGASLQPVFK